MPNVPFLRSLISDNNFVIFFYSKMDIEREIMLTFKHHLTFVPNNVQVVPFKRNLFGTILILFSHTPLKGKVLV